VRLRALWLAVGWAMVAAIVWLSLTANPPRIDIEEGDKLGHLASYATLMLWFSQLYMEKRTRALYALGFAAMGVALEFAQGATGYRSFDLADMLANALGVLCGWAAALILPRVLPEAGRETR
jgi:VanZ family protein